MSFHPDDFERLHAGHADPWGYQTHWYEARKRALTLAMLSRPHYGRVFEPGCSIGVLSRALAERCDALLCWDSSATALTAARTRFSDCRHVRFDHQQLPDTWPEGSFELIVFSELGYFLDRQALLTVTERMRHSLAAEGELLACHWRHPIAGGTLDGDAVHALLDERLGLARLSHHLEADMVVDLWSRDERSPARREELT